MPFKRGTLPCTVCCSAVISAEGLVTLIFRNLDGFRKKLQNLSQHAPDHARPLASLCVRHPKRAGAKKWLVFSANLQVLQHPSQNTEQPASKRSRRM